MKSSISSPVARPAPTRRLARGIVVISQVAALLGASVATISPARADSGPGGTATQITGTVFQDFNSNGVMNTAGDDANPAVDVGVAGVTVNAYAAGSSTAAATVNSGANGEFTLTGLTAGAPYRVEFSNLPAGFEPSFRGASGSTSVPSSGSSVQFVTAGTVNVSFGVNKPCDYCQNNPLIAINAFLPGSPTTSTNWSTSVFPYQLSTDRDGHVNGTTDFTTWTPAVPQPTAAASGAQTGNVFGMAWARNSRTLYTSAYYKIGVGYGTTGSGAIYKISNAGGASSVSLFADLNAISAGSAGTAAHNFLYFSTLSGPIVFSDTAPADEIGKESIGDVEISKDETYLYAVNLNDRRLYRIPTTGAVGPSTVTSYAIPTSVAGSSCPASDIRPFGLGKDSDENLYVGAVCSAQSTGLAANLAAYVWRFDEATGAFTVVLSGNPFTYGGWTAWSTSWPSPLPTSYEGPRQPMLTDIEFDGGFMMLGLRDRFGDQVMPWVLNSSNVYEQSYVKGSGDMLCTARNGATYQFENNKVCGTRTGGDTTFEAGPGGGAFFWNDYAGDGHGEAFMGSLSMVPGAREIMSSKMDAAAFTSAGVLGNCGLAGSPCSPNAAGVARQNTLNGDHTGAYDVYGEMYPAPNDNFPYYGHRNGKTSGVGDIETLCDPAPVQIGNRVWRDTNSNGIQDAGEPGIGGIVVELMIGTDVYTTTTDSSGEYYFSSANIADTTNANNGIVMAAGTSFMLTVNPNQGPLAGLALSPQNAGGQTDNNAIVDVRDSDAAIINGGAKINGAFGQPGQNNHGYDYGFGPPTTVSLGNRVWLDANNNGMYDGGETNISGVQLILFQDTNGDGVCSAGDTQVGTTQTNANGWYLFSNLQPSTNAATAYYVVVAAANFTGAGVLVGYSSSTGSTNSSLLAADNNKDHGAVVCGAVASTPIQLTAGNQPTGEPNEDNDATPDANSNLTIDFGFYRPAALGNYVWRDDNRNGVQDEPAANGQNGVTVQLKDAQNNVISTTVTANDVNGNPGYYTFTNLAPGTYSVGFVCSTLPPNATVTGKDQGGDDARDSDADAPMCMTPQITLAAGDVNPTLDLGFYLPVGLGDYVWYDFDKNGTQDPGELPVPGVMVTLTLNGQVVSTTMTNANGQYQFVNLQPGQPYVVCFKLPDGFNWTTPGTTPGSNTDSNVAPATGCSAPVTLGPNEFNPTIDAGLISPVTIDKLSATSGGVRGGIPVLGGDRIVTYTLAVRNTGSQPVNNVLVSDTLPANLTYVAGSGSPAPLTTAPLTWRIATIGAGQTSTITFRTSVASITGTIRNVAVVVASSIVIAQDPADIQAQPTAVSLSVFKADLAANGVNVSWVTALELNSLGFDLYRAENGERASAVKITPSMIAARSSGGSAYSHLDTTAQTGVRYSYWLRETELNGATNEYGPVSVGQPIAQAQQPAPTAPLQTVQIASSAVQPVVSLFAQDAQPNLAVAAPQAATTAGVTVIAVDAASVADAAAPSAVNVGAETAPVSIEQAQAPVVPVVAGIAEAAPAAAVEVAPVAARPQQAQPQAVAEARTNAVIATQANAQRGAVVSRGASQPSVLAVPAPARAAQPAQAAGSLAGIAIAMLTLAGAGIVGGVAALHRKRK